MRPTKIAYVYSQQIIGTKKAFISEYDFGVKLKLHIHILQIFEQNVISCYINPNNLTPFKF
jgi:hypothetical protein